MLSTRKVRRQEGKQKATVTKQVQRSKHGPLKANLVTPITLARYRGAIGVVIEVIVIIVVVIIVIVITVVLVILVIVILVVVVIVVIVIITTITTPITTPNFSFIENINYY